MKRLLLGTVTACAALVAPALAAPTEKMPVEFINEWCRSPGQDRGATEIDYTAPSWSGGTCTGVLVIDQWGFWFQDQEWYCDPVKVRTTKDVAPSGVSYTATVAARCYPGAQLAKTTTKTYVFSRYKGGLTVVVK
jgi:hypothetical protein